jgi:outer membrane protein TolC
MCVAFTLATAVVFDAGFAHARTVTEAELIQAFLRTAPERAVSSAAHAQVRAARTTRPYLPKPDLLLRQEQSFGSTEFSTSVAGLSLSLEIGGRYGLRKRAATLDAKAAVLLRQAEVVATVCDLRRRVQAAHAQQKIVALLSASLKQLERLPMNLKHLVAAGERARFDLDRMALLVHSHGQTLASHQARLEGMLAELSSLTGISVTAVRLGSAARSPAVASATATSAVRALRTRAEAEAQRIAEAGRRWAPDLDLYGAYRLDRAAGKTGHGYELGLTLSLPFTAAGRKARATAQARRRSLLARAARRQALQAAQLASLLGKAEELRRALKSDWGDPEKLHRDATRRYLTGVGPLSELVDTIRAVNEAALGRARAEAALRSITVEAECLRGAFDDDQITRLAREASQ